VSQNGLSPPIEDVWTVMSGWQAARAVPSPHRPKHPALSKDGVSSSSERLRSYLRARTTLTPEDLDSVLSLFMPRRLARGELLQRAGEPARWMVFVARGCLRSYAIDELGKVHIVRFAPEEWWLADTAPFLSGGPATLFIDAIEASDLM
jgi:hypothetical protein